MISAAQRAEIRRLFYAEHWPVGTIARELGLHSETVRSAIETERFNRHAVARRTKLDPYLPFIRETLNQYPRLRATRIHEMITERGYRGSVQQTRRLVRRLRPTRAEAYLRLRTLPGEQAQVDWGHFGKIEIGRATRSLSAFVMVLSWSRALHVVFTLDQSMENFLRGHVESFAFFGGTARTLLYDNLKSAVLARSGELVEFHPRLLELSGHYHFLPRPCAPARGNEKGRVERQIRFLRDRFFAARRFRDVDDLNAQFLRWRETWAHARPCPGDPDRSVADALEQERQRLLALPEHPFSCEKVQAVRSAKTPYIRFDRNDYSVPPELVRMPLTLVARHDELRILDGDRVVAQHTRSYDRGQVIEDPDHIEALVAHKRAARVLKGRDRLRAELPHAKPLLEQVIERGFPLGPATQQLLRLLDLYGATATDRALAEALERGTPTPSSVAQILDREQRRSKIPPHLPVLLPDRKGIRSLRVSTHNLEKYDDLTQDPEQDDPPHD